MRATDPFAGIETTRPIRCTGASTDAIGSVSSSDEGATICTSWPRARNCSARCETCSVTPPGYAKSYGETSASFIACRSSPGPTPLENGPLLRMVGDIVLQAFSYSLSYAHHVLLRLPRKRHFWQRLHPRVEATARLADRHGGQDWRPCSQRQPGRPVRKLRRGAEKRDERARATDVPIRHEPQELVPAQRQQQLAYRRCA